MIKINKSISTIFSVIALCMILSSQTATAQRIKGNSDDRRKEWMVEMRNFKHEFFKKELGLTREQEVPFFKAYDEMDDELIRIGEETRQLERKINADSDASDTELESAARTLFEQKKREAEVELTYFEEFKNILTKRQLLRLKETERRFNRALLNHNREKQHPKVD